MHLRVDVRADKWGNTFGIGYTDNKEINISFKFNLNLRVIILLALIFGCPVLFMSFKAMNHKSGHADLTASEPRDPNLHRVTLSTISQATDTVRLIRLSPEPSTAFKARDPRFRSWNP